jgi:hypothetical protein
MFVFEIALAIILSRLVNVGAGEEKLMLPTELAIAPVIE